ncbi:DMT family transporter, partial [Sarcina ventriculi]|uniref:DMT family transporter n=1 Tax=Sarcina ventriculi TaxID=1267 RepID=UPI000DD32162
KKLKTTISKKLMKSSAILGGLLFVGFVFMVLGLKYTSTDDASFLTCLSGIFIPIISFICFKQKLKLKVIISIIIVFIGVYLLTMTGGTLSLNLGDILCLISCAILSFQVIITNKLNKDVDALSLGIFQIGFSALFSVIFTALFGVLQLPPTGTSWFVIITLSILCTAIPYVVQTISLKYSSPVHAGIIYSLQPVFSAIFVLIFTGVGLTTQGYIGALLMVISIIIVELDFQAVIRKLKTK